LVELIRAFLARPAEAQIAMRAFFAAAVMRSSITASIDASGALILRAPEAAPVLAALSGRTRSEPSHFLLQASCEFRSGGSEFALVLLE